MRILHVVPSYLPALRYGGPILSVHGLCKALVARGHDVHVFTTNIDGPGESDVPLGFPSELDGVKVWYFPVPALRRLYWSPSMRTALLREAGGFDVIHTHSIFLWPTWAAARIARRRRVPYVLAPRGMLVRDLVRRKNRWIKSAWIRLVERRSMANAAMIHFTSRIEAEEAAALGLPVPRSCNIPNGVDIPPETPARFPAAATSAGPGAPFLLFIGRISWKKGLDRLIAALPLVPGCELVIRGFDDENLTPSLSTLARRAGVAGRVSFGGPVHGDEKLVLLRRALLLVLPSHSENFGNVVLEAMAAGCPVVVTPQVGAADIVRESSGGVVLDGCPENLGAGIRLLVSNPAELKRMGARGREFVARRLAWDAVCVEMEEAYRLAVSA